MKLKGDMWQVTGDGKESAARLAPSCHASLVTRHAHGMALVITVILIAVVTFMAITFLAMSRRERGAVTTTTDTITAQLAADDALAAAEAQIVANTLATTNPYNFGLLVSTNYINPYGFVSGIANPTNVNYYYTSGKAVSKAGDFLQLLANLQYLPRAPVLLDSNEPLQGRFYLDLNRNEQYDTNGVVGDFDNKGNLLPNDVSEVGDPEWIGVLQHPDQPYGPNNPFVARYAFVAVPIGNALDLNSVFNQAADPRLAGGNSIPVNTPPPGGAGNDSYLRNQGVGSWEINLAAFLGDLNTNEWLLVQPPSAKYYYYQRASDQNQGVAFNDARALLAYRYANDYKTLFPVSSLFANVAPFQGNIDYYSDLPPPQNVTWPWSGADNTNHFFDMQELFDPTKANIGAATTLNSFTNRLTDAGRGTSTYDRYTYYRLISQMGVDSAPLQNQINLNYSNAFAYFNNNGIVTNIAYSPQGQTNLAPWTPLQFFTIAADRMLRTYSQEWLTENPTNYLVTYGMTTNISTAADPGLFPTNVPLPFSITNIPVLVSNQFVYTPAIQRVLQLAANMYDSVYCYSNNLARSGSGYPATNLPSVFRPFFTFARVLGPSRLPLYTNVYISGFSLVSNVNQLDIHRSGYPSLDHPVTAPYDLANPIAIAFLSLQAGPYYINAYGVPWIIGAKKGFPNFNKFDVESTFQLTRKLQVTRPSTNSPLSDYQYNQEYNLSLSNQIGVEYWNSYTNSYNRPTQIYVTNYVSVALTNDESLNPDGGNTNFMVWGYLQIPNASDAVVPGYNPVTDPLGSLHSFQIPLAINVGAIPTSMYRFNVGANAEEPGHTGPYLTTNLDYGWGNFLFESGVTWNAQLYPQPHWYLVTTNYLQAVMVDTAGGIIDYVALRGPNSVRDLTGEIVTNYDTPINTSQASGSELWNTNFQGGLPIGMVSQIGVSMGNYTASATSGTWDQTDHTLQADEIAAFSAFFGYTPPPPFVPGELDAIAAAQMTNAIQAPYSPVATVVQHVSWQANDPLVHYLASDLNWSGAIVTDRNVASLTNNNPNGTLGQLNQRYMPWGGNPLLPNEDQNPYNYALKDSLVRTSDNWDFPTYNLPTIGWLGRVHRGTPWQTVYLKSSDILQQVQVTGNVTNDIGTNTWVSWTGNSLLAPPTIDPQFYDAANTAPAQDRLLFDLFTTAPNDNATRGQLSVNVGASDPNNPQAGLAAWSALLSGVVMPTNLFGGYTFIQPAGPVGGNALLGALVANINNTRTNFVNADGLKGVFEHVGDVLGAPALTVSNQWILLNNTNAISGISDEMYEWLPQQVLSLLRVSGTPQSPMRYIIYSYGQTLKPAPNGIYTGSATVNRQTESAFGMVTNYQVVAESATRSVVNFGSVETNFVNVTSDGFNQILNNVPAVTNNTAQIQQFNSVPPY